MIARVPSITFANAWSKGGLMIRETLDAGSKHATILVSAGKGVAFQRREATNGTSVSTAGSPSGSATVVEAGAKRRHLHGV